MASFVASQLYSPSLEAILLVLALVFGVFLIVAAGLSNRTSATNRVFIVLTVSSLCWLVSTYAARVPQFLSVSIYIHRLGIFFAAPMSASLFLLAHTIPSRRIKLSRSWFWTIILLTAGMMALNLSPYAFVSYTVINGISSPVPGLGLIPFSILSTVFSVGAVYLLVRKYLKAEGAIKKQLQLVLSGMFIMIAFILVTILVPVLTSANSSRFLSFSPLYLLVFLGMTAYAITQYQLFNVKMLATQALTFALVLVLFARIFGEQTTSARVVDVLVLVTVAVFGYFLVRSVQKEVEQRERIERLAAELETTNERQEGLIHFIGHEVKGFLTKAQGALAMLVDGDFGQLPHEAQTIARQALQETQDGVESVSSILKASNLKRGTVTFKREPFDFRALVDETVVRSKPMAEKKGLAFTYEVAAGNYAVTGDRQELGDHVLRNLLDNAMNYTPSGSIAVTLAREGSTLRFSVKDTGVGITAEDRDHLFTEGGHGKDSQRINVHSTGYGLYIAKQVVEAQGGTIRAESEGASKGSTFIVEFPAKSGSVQTVAAAAGMRSESPLRAAGELPV